MSKGADSGSEKNIGDMFRLLSPNWFSMRRLVRLMRRLYTVELIQIMDCFDSQTRGMSIAVGIIIFSIAGDLGFGRGLRRRYWRLLRVGKVLGLLRRQRKLKVR